MTETLSDNQHLETGKSGEEYATTFLKKRGLKIVERNYWKKWGEIDIVAKSRDCLHFVEVKTVTRLRQARLPDGQGYGGQARQTDGYEPEENVHPWKRARLRRVIETYLLDKKISDEQDWQVDVISVYLDPIGGVIKIDYLEDVIL